MVLVCLGIEGKQKREDLEMIQVDFLLSSFNMNESRALGNDIKRERSIMNLARGNGKVIGTADDQERKRGKERKDCKITCCVYIRELA